VLAIAFAAVLVLAAIAPAVQTWVARAALAGGTGARGSLESLSAGFGEIDLEGLHLEAGGAVLTLPSLQARLPLTTAALGRRFLVRSLVARGWTLDLSRAGEPAGGQAQRVPGGARAAGALEAARVIREILGGRQLPVDGSLDGVELEGDVLLAASPGGPPAHVHLVVTGGGVSAAHEGAFTFEAAVAAPGTAVNGAAPHGRLVVAMDAARRVSRLEVRADIPDPGGLRQKDLTLSAEVAAARGAGEETYALDLSRGSRHVATVAGRFPGSTRRFAGIWKIDLRESDFAPYWPDRTLPALTAAGEGHFDADAAFARVRVLGSLDAVVGRLGVVAPPLERLGTVTLAARFDLAHSGQSLRVESLSLAVSGARPAALVQSLQPFVVDETTGALRASDPAADWLDASIKGLPLDWLPGTMEGATLAGGDATGEFVVRAADGGFALRPKAPLTAAGVVVQQAGRIIGRDLDLSLSMLGVCSPTGWQVQWAPLAVSSAGRRLATIDLRASHPAGAEQPTAITGKWDADLDAMAAQQAFPALSWAAVRSASGGFSATLGPSTVVEASLVVLGHSPGNSLEANVHADVDAYGAMAFAVPVKIKSGSGVSEMSAEGTWAGGKEVSWVKARVTGGSVGLDHLRLLARMMAGAGSMPSPGIPGTRLAAGPPAAPGGRDRAPFWGDLTGHVTVAFDRLRTGDDEYAYVGGVFDIDRDSIRMKGGHGGLGHHVVTNVEGSISFDAAAESPYRLKAAAALNEIDTALLFAAAQPGRDPVFEGRFSVQGTLAGSGIGLDDLLSRTQAEFQLTSSAGIIRVLKANVAESIPEASSPVADTLGTVGYVVGSVFGMKGDSVSSGKNPVSKTADAVLNFTYQVSEIGYDRATVKAVRGNDGTIHLVDIEMTAPDERLKGSGQITYIRGLPLFARPLSVELQLGARGKVAELLATAGLLSPGKDSLGFATLAEPVRLGGTLEHIDDSRWNALLVKAATRKPESGKKSAEGPAHGSP